MNLLDQSNPTTIVKILFIVISCSQNFMRRVLIILLSSFWKCFFKEIRLKSIWFSLEHCVLKYFVRNFRSRCFQWRIQKIQGSRDYFQKWAHEFSKYLSAYVMQTWNRAILIMLIQLLENSSHSWEVAMIFSIN